MAANPPMKAVIVPVTPLQQNCTLIWCTRTMRGALVDPGGDLDRLKQAVEKAGVTLEKLLVTHGHLDHCGQTGIQIIGRMVRRSAHAHSSAPFFHS